MSVTIRDVARSLNLSHTTVSRVLNGRDAISIPAVTRERVRTAAKQMGYTPNRAARALATGRTHLVALQMYRLSSPYAWLVSQEMQAVVAGDGYEVLVREFGGGDLTVQSSVDGILALDSAHPPGGGGERLSVPYVLMGSQAPPSQTLDCVSVDLGVGTRQATQFLIKQGRRRIVHVTSQDIAPGRDARCGGYCGAMEAAGLRAAFLTVPDDRRVSGAQAVRQCAAAGDLPDALVCRNDELAAGCMHALHELGRRIPEDVAVIGCDGTEEGAFLFPPLSTIVPPVPEMCRLAWQFLRRRMAEPDAPQQTAHLTSSFLLRASAGASCKLTEL